MKHGFPDHLASARLLLRRLHRDDAAALCAYRSLPEVARYQSWDSFSQEDAARLIESQSAPELDIPGTWFQLAIVEAATGDFIGDCGLHCPKDNSRQMEIGITVSSRHQGRGYATEAVECVLDNLFGSLDKHRVFASTDVLNLPAAALFRRLGFRQEAHMLESLWFKGQWGSEYLFALLKREWEERHSQMTATPNHALQRTAPAVTLAASGHRLAAAMQPARQPPQSLSLRSLGSAALSGTLNLEFRSNWNNPLDHVTTPVNFSASFNASICNVSTASNLSTSFNPETTFKILIGRTILNFPSTLQHA